MSQKTEKCEEMEQKCDVTLDSRDVCYQITFQLMFDVKYNIPRHCLVFVWANDCPIVAVKHTKPSNTATLFILYVCFYNVCGLKYQLEITQLVNNNKSDVLMN